MRVLLAGAAVLALTASAAYADPGKGGGGGKGGNGGDKPAAAAGPSKGGDHGNGHGGGKAAQPGHAVHAAKANRATGPAKQHVERAQSQPARAAVARDDRGKGANKGQSKDVQRQAREVRDVRVADQSRFDRRDDPRVVRTVVSFDRDRNRGLIEGCPPGLAKKNNGCQPPGLARQNDDYRDAYYRPSWFGYSSAGDGRYYYDDGYLYRTNNTGSVLGFIPLLGGALSVGNPWPSYYQPAPVPDYYSQYYNLGSPDSYRYADDVLYRVDPQNSAITSIAALLTGDQFAVGQRMPAGYDVYNVPYEYRDQYYDSPQADYRYADGYVYEVDPTTQLVQAAIQLLT